MSSTRCATPISPPPPPDPDPVSAILEEARAAIREQRCVPIKREKTLVGALKAAGRFDYARKLLEICRARPAPASLGPTKQQDHDLWRAQQHSLCTYKDRDLPADERLKRAWAILQAADDPACSVHQETLGQAGAIHKRLWELDTDSRHLERSLHFYLRGYELGVPGTDNGYTAINAAFVLDLLARQESADAAASGRPGEDAREKREKAERIRREIVTALGFRPFPAGADSWWYAVTVAEAYFGLGEFCLAEEWLQQASTTSPAGWEIESTARQLAQLYLLRAGEASAGTPVRSGAEQALSALLGGDPEAVRSAFTGKVGLALSGGGFRASLFHLGVLAYLAEADVLRHVEVISCVSGGSIVGAHYYLALKDVLASTPDREIGPGDYVGLVRRVATTFLAGVQRNVRMRVLANPWASARMVLREQDSRTRRAGLLYERELYDRLHGPPMRKGRAQNPRRSLEDLPIIPAGKAADFSPRDDNWLRRNKVPTLVLNATTLNTGHNWQFTGSWMGEPPGPIDSDVDGNDWLRRMPYRQAPPQYRKVPLGDAVAASACVPGLFEPLSLPGLYPDRTVRLVDGGVHDNQGLASLLEQECSVILVSDASGQMTSQPEPASAGALPALRSNSILQARVRQAQHRDLVARQSASLLRGVAFLHLQRDLPVAAVDWVDCPEPEDLFGDRTRRPKEATEYGIPTEIQRLLAGIRTDLDSFHRAEAYALMTSGYRMAARYLPEAFPGTAGPSPDGKKWFFQDVERIFEEREGDTGRYERLKELLAVSGSVGFKAWRISRHARDGTLAALLVLASVVGSALLLTGVGRTLVLWVALSPVVLAAVALLGLLLGFFRVTRGIGRMAGVVTGTAMGLVGWLVAGLYLVTLDRLYLWEGELGLEPPPD
ncbi:MAG TPA: patatin-like phospholipase family protein [Longimicrobiaceae bacterium]|nr:patatin-like phospholipase family protein [Longimicrobiaceae bacterium]